MASTICRRCHRPLKDPKSIERGMGEICAKKEGGQTSIMPEDKDVRMIPFEGDVVVRREGGLKYMNIPQTIVYHSPTGLEWGYAGSGPADFALNILYFFTNDKEFAMKWHQDFKFQFVAGLPREGGVIKKEDIDHFIKMKKSPLHIQTHTEWDEMTDQERNELEALVAKRDVDFKNKAL